MAETLIVKSEEDAYEILRHIIDDTLDLKDAKVSFEGWPKLHIHLTGKKYDQTITPTMMKGFLELQREIHRSYCLTKYGTPNLQHLSKDERNDLEIRVKVSDGSSNYEIDLQELFLKLVEMVGDKMEPVHVVTTVLGIGLMFFGQSSFRIYLDHRKSVREKELTSEEHRAQIEALKFSGEQETERAKVMANIIKRAPQLENIEKSAHDAQTVLVKSFVSADEAEFQGVSIDPDVAHELTTNARRKSEEIRLDGTFKICRVDSTDPTAFKVKIKNIDTREEIDARVQDSSLTPENKSILQDAEWSRKPVMLQINAKELRGHIRDAVVIKVTKVNDNNED